MEGQQYRPYEKDEDELIGLKTALDDDPNAPKEDKSSSNYRTKVTDPTGANSEEAGTTPLVESFEKMSVNEEVKSEKSKSSDKGVSMKEFLAEKFKPREEDKALSEVISVQLSGRKDKSEGSEQAKPRKEVKKPEGVATQKGSTGEQRAAAGGAAGTHGEGAGKSMINRLKGTASSWFHKGSAKPPTAAAEAAVAAPTSTTHGT